MSEKQRALNHLVRKLCKSEIGKVQLNAGQAREVLKRIATFQIHDEDFNFNFGIYKLHLTIEGSKKRVGARRAKR